MMYGIDVVMLGFLFTLLLAWEAIKFGALFLLVPVLIRSWNRVRASWR